MTALHMVHMDFHMKTTLTIDDALMKRVKVEAARRGATMAELIENALRVFLRQRPEKVDAIAALPSFDGGGALVDLADRDALYRTMDGR